nr:unnamed protein product [Callosobruchus chinensis]
MQSREGQLDSSLTGL